MSSDRDRSGVDWLDHTGKLSCGCQWHSGLHWGFAGCEWLHACGIAPVVWLILLFRGLRIGR